MFEKLTISEWRQFKSIDISFHPRITVITGANGSGKTTLLNILAKHFNWEPKFISSYDKDEQTGKYKYTNGIRADLRDEPYIKALSNGQDSRFVINEEQVLGLIYYTNGQKAIIQLPAGNNTTYTVMGLNMLNGIYISSHRPTFPYKELKKIPTIAPTKETISKNYLSFSKLFFDDSYRNQEELSAVRLIKETLATLAIFGYGNQAVMANREARELFEGYEEILRKVLPRKLGFKNIVVSIPEVMLSTKTGDFPLDAASGGISSIIDITWQLYMSPHSSESKYVVIIDEPENHLHPELQKSFLPNLLEAFPNAQFIIATHNPFMISAVQDSYVYVLKYNENNKVYSIQLDYANKAGTANVILRDVLGIDTSMPFWAEDKLAEIINKYSQQNISNIVLDNLRQELSSLGFEGYIPSTIARIIEANGNDKVNKS